MLKLSDANCYHLRFYLDFALNFCRENPAHERYAWRSSLHKQCHHQRAYLNFGFYEGPEKQFHGVSEIIHAPDNGDTARFMHLCVHNMYVRRARLFISLSENNLILNGTMSCKLFGKLIQFQALH